MDKKKDVGELFARLDDLRERAARGELGISAFLSPRELYYAQDFLKKQGAYFISFGGYTDAERKRVYLLPEYMQGIEAICETQNFGYTLAVSALLVKGSGFVKLSHRDFMGSLLALGIERSVIGDIVLLDEHKAVVFCDSTMLNFLKNEWKQVGRDKVKITDFDSFFYQLPERKYESISDTVASSRLDCVIGAFCSLSREKAKQTVEAGMVEIDYEIEQKADRTVLQGNIISIRGYGKFRVVSLNDKTKKGRYRLVGEKYL